MKTGISEGSLIVVGMGALNATQTFLLANPVIPEPWLSLVMALVGCGIFFARSKMKKAA